MLRTVVRVRPLLAKEAERDEQMAVVVTGEDICLGGGDGEPEILRADACFDHSTPHATIFDKEVLPLMPAVIQGSGSATIVCAGIAGAGKSSTITGLLSRAVPTLLEQLKIEVLSKKTGKPLKPKGSNTLDFSYFEVYNERVYDLLEASAANTKPKALPLRENTGNQIVIAGLGSSAVTSFDQFKARYVPFLLYRPQSFRQVQPGRSTTEAIESRSPPRGTRWQLQRDSDAHSPPERWQVRMLSAGGPCQLVSPTFDAPNPCHPPAETTRRAGKQTRRLARFWRAASPPTKTLGFPSGAARWPARFRTTCSGAAVSLWCVTFLRARRAYPGRGGR
jgi:hypothetical protein